MKKLKIILIFCFTFFTLNILNPEFLFIEGCPEKLKAQYSWLTDDLYHIISCNAAVNNLETEFVLAVIQAESQGHRRAKSKAGAIGYMQIMPFHLPGKEKRLYNTGVNIRIGCRILKDCYKLAKGDMVETLKNYNAGPRGKYYNIPYIKKIVKNYLIARL